MPDKDEIPSTSLTSARISGAVVASAVAFIAVSIVVWCLVGPSGFEEQNELLRTLVQLLGAFGLAGGLFFTFQTVRSSQETLRLSREQHRFEQLSGVAERYHRALDLLSEHGELKNIGAFESMKRLALDHPDYLAEVRAVIASTISARAARKPIETVHLPMFTGQTTPSDVRFALSVLAELGTSDAKTSRERVNLPFTNLRGVTLSGGSLHEVDLKASLLHGFAVMQTDLAGADFTFADLKGAMFANAPLQHASFGMADLKDAWFVYPTVDRETFDGVVSADVQARMRERAQFFGRPFDSDSQEGLDYGYMLTGIDFLNANLTGAYLEDVDLRGVRNLTWAQVRSAKTNERTQLPDYLVHNQEN